MLERGKMDRDLVEFVLIDQLVPKEHLLRKIDAVVDFTHLYEMAEPLYCEDNGRPSIDTVGAVQNGADPASVRTATTAADSRRSKCKHLLPLVLRVHTARGNAAFFNGEL